MFIRATVCDLQRHSPEGLAAICNAWADGLEPPVKEWIQGVTLIPAILGQIQGLSQELPTCARCLGVYITDSCVIMNDGANEMRERS